VAIGYDNANSVIGTGLSSITIPAFAVAGADRCIVVGVNGVKGTATSTSSVVRNGSETFTPDWNVTNVSGWEQHNSGHHFANPATGSYSIVVTLAAITDYIAAGAISLTGVHQTTPVGTPETASGTGTTASVTVTAADDEWLVDMCGVEANAITVGADQTARVEIDDATSSFSSIGMSHQLGSVAGDVMTWTCASVDWVIGAVPIKPAVAAIPPPPPPMAAQQRMG